MALGGGFQESVVMAVGLTSCSLGNGWCGGCWILLETPKFACRRTLS